MFIYSGYILVYTLFASVLNSGNKMIWNGKLYKSCLGFLFCKYKSNWVKRWCSVKNAKLMIYKHPSNDLPELVVLLVYAALRVPTNEDLTDQYFFKLRYEGTKCVMLRTKHKRDWKQWIAAIGVNC